MGSSKSVADDTRHTSWTQKGKGPNDDESRDSCERYPGSLEMAQTQADSPDGGWGWMVVLGAFLSSIIVGMMFILFSVIYIDLMEHFQTDSAVTGWVASLFFATGNCVGIVFSVLVKRYGCRFMAIVGSIVWSIALGLSSFTNNVFAMYVSYGIVGGCGFNIALLTNVVVVQQYFSRHRALAAGIASTGISVGSLLTGPLIRYLLDEFGWQGTLIVFSGIVLHGVVAGILYFPLPIKQQTSVASMPHECNLEGEVEAVENDISNNEAVGSRDTWKVLIKDVCNPNLFYNVDFTLFCIGTMFINFGIYTFYQHTPSRAAILGVSNEDVAWIPTVIGASSITSRLFFGWLANFRCTTRTLQYGLSMTFSGILTVCSYFFRTFISISIYGALQGIGIGCCLTVQSTVMVDLVGVENIAKAHGLLYMFVGAAGLLSVPFAGLLFDISQNYDIPFHVNGSVQLMGSFLLLAVWWRRRSGKTLSNNTL